MITVRKTFQVTNILLIASAALTMMQSYKTLNKKTTLSLQLSSVVCIIAAYHYHLMIISPDNQTAFRYLDWFITTPLLLWELCLVIDVNPRATLPIAIILNTFMLLAGFFCELTNGNRIVWTVIGSIPLITMYRFIHCKTPIEKKRLVDVFFSIWSFYGIVNFIPQEAVRAVCFNILDIISKAAFGLLMVIRNN